MLLSGIATKECKAFIPIQFIGVVQTNFLDWISSDRIGYWTHKLIELCMTQFYSSSPNSIPTNRWDLIWTASNERLTATKIMEDYSIEGS